MIYPTDEQLLGGIAAALKDTVLPELARGSAARKQLQAAIETLRRMAFAAPGQAAALAADNADIAEVLRRVDEILAEAGHSPPPHLPHQGGGTRIHEALPLDGGGLGGGDAAEANRTLQQKLADLQTTIPPDVSPQITPLLTKLYARMTDRALALIPPPMPRTPRKPA
jgi:hypothetical protein